MKDTGIKVDKVDSEVGVCDDKLFAVQSSHAKRTTASCFGFEVSFKRIFIKKV